MARLKNENKQQRMAREVANAVGAGVLWHLETVDFSDPNRPKTCLEVDFPILPINHIAAIEGNAGKPIYQMSKWWARRRSSVFRSMLIAASTKAPDDPAEAAKLVWDAYYGDHQNNESFRKLKVADIFMGGGTTIVEGARLGMRMYGNDLNPVAWFVVKNELTQVDPNDVKLLLARIEADVKPLIIPFYACDCPRGHKGQWTQKANGKVMGRDFDPLAVTPEDRPSYEYSGPEVIYTFWAKHGPCQADRCHHRTPIMSSPVIAVKTLTVKAWKDVECTKCGGTFDVEAQDARIAPAALFVVSHEEPPYAVQDEHRHVTCPHCQNKLTKILSAKAKNKSVELTLLIHPDWLKGSPSNDQDGKPHGGTVTDSADSTARWNAERARTLKLIEFRGPLPERVACPDTKAEFYTDGRGGTVPKKSTFICKEDTCGRPGDVLDSIKATNTSGPVAMYAIQGYCPSCNLEGRSYSGRFFSIPNIDSYNAAYLEWETRKGADLKEYWPKSELPFGFMTHMNNGGIPNHGFSHWWKMFNPRQLLVQTQLLRSITSSRANNEKAKEFVLGGFQQYLRNQNMFCIWNVPADKMEPMFSNNNFHPKATMIENSVFADLGRGNWASSAANIQSALAWKGNPWETVSVFDLDRNVVTDADSLTSKSVKTFTNDPVVDGQTLDSRSSSDLVGITDSSHDLVITDPPFGGLLHYAELADFFYVWLRLVLKEHYADKFTNDYTPKTLEAVSNRARHPEDADEFYQKILTECWREAWRILKPGGLLAFTFHHSEDEPWVAVLESLFQAGFYLEATYPIRSDETKGEGAKPGTFGSQLIEYDIIHVCRKRTDEPQPISWAKLRRMILQDVRQLKNLLEQHHNAGLQAADLQVIRRGKALEYYSRHYGMVYVERGREFPVKDALLAINQMLDEESDATTEAPPAHAEAYTRQFFRLFTARNSLSRDQMSKHLRGTGVSPQEFIERGWCDEKQKVFYAVSPLAWAKAWRGVARSVMSRDFDQGMFMVGACYEGSGIKLSDTLNSPTFLPHPATGDILDWLVRNGADVPMKTAAHTARQLFKTWLSKKENQEKMREQQLKFGFDEAGE